MCDSSASAVRMILSDKIWADHALKQKCLINALGVPSIHHCALAQEHALSNFELAYFTNRRFSRQNYIVVLQRASARPRLESSFCYETHVFCVNASVANVGRSDHSVWSRTIDYRCSLVHAINDCFADLTDLHALPPFRHHNPAPADSLPSRFPGRPSPPSIVSVQIGRPSGRFPLPPRRCRHSARCSG